MTMQQLYLVVPMVPLVASIVVGLWGNKMPRPASHWITNVKQGGRPMAVVAERNIMAQSDDAHVRRL